jgi:hypothetical protein
LTHNNEPGKSPAQIIDRSLVRSVGYTLVNLFGFVSDGKVDNKPNQRETHQKYY